MNYLNNQGGKKMKTMNLRKDQINRFASIAFEAMGYSDLIGIDLCFVDDHEPLYNVYFRTFYQGEKTKILKELNLTSMIRVIRLGMELSGYYIIDLQPRIKESVVSIIANVNAVDKERKLSKKR